MRLIDADALMMAIDKIEPLDDEIYDAVLFTRLEVRCAILDAPTIEAVQGYTEWLEKIIVEAETLEWLCEDTPCKEWFDENCHYSSIQVECLRHLYEVSKGGAE